jgi:hypothetical protein
MADNSNQQGNDPIRTLDRSGTKTQQFGFDVARSGDAELLGPADSRTLLLTSAGLTTASTNYTTGDQMGTEMSHATAVRTAKGLVVVSASIVDKAKVIGATDLYVFDASTTPAADNAAAAWSDADMLKLLGIIHFNDVITSGNNYQVLATNLPLVLKPASGTTVYFDFVARANPAFFGAVGDLQVRLGIVQD